MSFGQFGPNIKVSLGAAPVKKLEKIAEPRTFYNNCPLCESEELLVHFVADCSGHPLFTPAIPDQITWKQCKKCEHVFTEGFYTKEALEVIFSNTHDNQKPGNDFERQRFISAKIVEKVAQHSELGSWLDVGFGNGSLLFTADEWGFKPVGLDLRLSSVNEMCRLGVEAYCQDIQQFESKTNFSVISLADVLEHMPYPKKGLQAVRRLLKPNGTVFISMPNYNCLAWRLLDQNNANAYWGELEHYHNFSRQRLFLLLDEMGFAPVSYGISERYRVCMEIIARKI
jgi:SAM-dependent methyltransferase